MFINYMPFLILALIGIDNYFDKNKKPKSTDIIIQLFHTVDGKVIALNFGKDGYMVTIVPGQEIICEYDGKCLNFKG